MERELWTDFASPSAVKEAAGWRLAALGTQRRADHTLALRLSLERLPDPRETVLEEP